MQNSPTASPQIKKTEDTPAFDRRTAFAVVVTYHPGRDVLEHIEILLKYFSRTVVVDNTDAPGCEDLLAQLEHKNGIDLLENGQNLGVAEALNQGISRAKALGASWIATFDQDSVLKNDLPGIIAANSHLIRSSTGRVIFGCSYVDPILKKRFPFPPDIRHVDFVPAKELLTAGMCFSADTFDHVGGFDSKLFIDMVDHEFCLRARLKGCMLYKTSAPVLVHPVGSNTGHNLFGKLYASNHPPSRRYYYARNTILVFKRFIFRRPATAAHYLFRLLEVMLLIVLLERQKTEKTVAILCGMYHGLLGMHGEFRGKSHVFSPKALPKKKNAS